MKQYKYLGVILAILLIPFYPLYPSDAETFSAKVTDISGGDYFPAVMEAVEGAEINIFVVMYLMRFNPQTPDSKVGMLIDALVKAKEKGVEVTVILGRNVDYKHRQHIVDMVQLEW